MYPATQDDINVIIEELRKALDPNWFTYYFNSPVAAIDTDFWTEGGDAGGGFSVETVDNEPPSRKLYTSGVINEKYYIHGDGKYAKLWNLQSSAYIRVHYVTKLKANQSGSDILALFGLFEAGAFPTDYAEPNIDCAQFFIDVDTDANYACRTFDGGEEQTSSGVAVDTEYHKFEIIWAETSVLFLIDDDVVATHSTQIPDSPLGLVYLVKAEAAAEKSKDIEYVEVSVE
jgi:hypothetical protein